MKIIVIAAVALDRAIGRKGELLVRLKADMRHFRQATLGHTVIMGRRTFESLPSGALPGRRNIVVTRNADFAATGCLRASSLEEALRLASDNGETEAYVIGGGQIYAEAIDVANELDITELQIEASDADTWFPPIDTQRWVLTDSSEEMAEEGLRFRFRKYVNRL